MSIGQDEIIVPAGTRTDFSSIPQLFAWFVRWSKVDVAGVVHDWLYQSGELPRKDADRVWRVVAQSGIHAANPLQAFLGYIGLRLGGWYAWRNHRKNDGRPGKGRREGVPLDLPPLRPGRRTVVRLHGGAVGGPDKI